MKLLALAFLLSLSACEKYRPACYSFQTTRTTFSEPAQQGYPVVEQSTQERCGLTRSEANAVALELTDEHKVKIGITTLTVSDVTKFRKQK